MNKPLPRPAPEPFSPPANLLEELLAAGRNMQSALEKGRIETYFDLLDERGRLLDQLSAYRHPSDVAQDWDRRAAELVAQNDALMRTAVAQRQRMQETLNRIGQVKAAQRSYRQAVARNTILDDNLRG